MHQILTDAYNALLHVLLPIRCVVCKKESAEALCNTCLIGFTFVQVQICPTCRQPSVAGLVHGSCAHSQSLDQLISLYDYKSVAELVIAGKYKFVPDAFHIIAPRISTLVKNSIDLPTDTVVTPLPLHRSRERWRGFNQAAILAHRVSLDLNLPYAEILIRNRRTKTQKDLKKAERLTNVAGCFSLIAPARLPNHTILLIDDVTTSGNTLQEAARTLKQHGATHVIGVTLAKD